VAHFSAGGVLFVPTIVLYEVTKILLKRHCKTAADIFLSQALRRTVFSFDQHLALASASASLQYQIGYGRRHRRCHDALARRRSGSLIGISQIYPHCLCFDFARLDRIFSRR
jgi:hypothetical protein